jgi:Predicted membrane protein
VKNEFLRQINRLIKDIPKKDRQDILSDLEEHFTIGFSEG